MLIHGQVIIASPDRTWHEWSHWAKIHTVPGHTTESLLLRVSSHDLSRVPTPISRLEQPEIGTILLDVKFLS